MNREHGVFDEDRRLGEAFDREPETRPRPLVGPLANDDELQAIARSEGWHEPPREVTQVALRPWQQAVFWGLRVYIVVMLAVMVVGFAHVASGQ
jgi:hypothetical protein